MNSGSGFYAVPRLKPLNESKHCFECGLIFNVFKPKYHCRNCGNVVCSNCSSHKYPLQKFGYENPVRCCNTCEKFIQMQTMTSNELIKLPTKLLKEYIQAYHLSTTKSAMIEKSDLVKVIFNARPISNENECYYRFNRGRNNIQQQERTITNSNPPRQMNALPAARMSSSKSTPATTNNILTLNDLVKRNIDPSTLPIRTLKSILKANFVEQSHVIEKSELVRLVKRLVNQQKEEESRVASNEDSLCRICCDAQQNCVFLDCGHMVTCMDCAKKLIQTKNECPICRESIIKLVHVFRS